MTSDDYNRLQMQLCGESTAILEDMGLLPADAYNAMLREPEMLMTWWGGVFEQSEADHAAIDAAARAFAAGLPLPELTVPQRARLALRLRLSSRIVRAISSRQHVQPKGWFPDKLRRMTSRELVEWILLDGWHFCAEVFDEAMLWADEIEPPLAPSTRRSLPASSSPDASSLSE
jgi:hypothetical protein